MEEGCGIYVEDHIQFNVVPLETPWEVRLRLCSMTKWPDSEVTDSEKERMISPWERAAEEGVLSHQ